MKIRSNGGTYSLGKTKTQEKRIEYYGTSRYEQSKAPLKPPSYSVFQPPTTAIKSQPFYNEKGVPTAVPTTTNMRHEQI